MERRSEWMQRGSWLDLGCGMSAVGFFLGRVVFITGTIDHSLIDMAVTRVVSWHYLASCDR
jgi:hypothetical protein